MRRVMVVGLLWVGGVVVLMALRVWLPAAGEVLDWVATWGLLGARRAPVRENLRDAGGEES